GNQFLLEANSQQGSAQKPLISMKLMNGEFSLVRNNHPPLDEASLTAAEAAGLWDAITRSFRARPGAF
ncbi:MAG: T6SS immunity protein Tli4 family protein, partial [Marinobacter sp.]